jgi:hypothetical protein
MFVDPYEIAQGHGKVSLLGGGKRIKTQRIFQTRHQNGKAENQGRYLTGQASRTEAATPHSVLLPPLPVLLLRLILATWARLFETVSMMAYADQRKARSSSDAKYGQ